MTQHTLGQWQYNKGTLNKFGTRIDSSVNQQVKFVHLKTRFRVLFEGFGLCADTDLSDGITMDIYEADTPKGNHTSKELKLVNGTIKYPGEWKWDSYNFKVYNSYDNRNYKALQNQLQKQRDFYNITTGDSPDNYKFRAIFEHTDGHQLTLSKWVMEGCWLSEANSDSASAESYDAMTISCKMEFDNATLYDRDGNVIVSAASVTSPNNYAMAK